jgi:hypothetical protein
MFYITILVKPRLDFGGELDKGLMEFGGLA